MDNGTTQASAEPKKTRRDSSSKHLSSPQLSVDKNPQATPRTSKTKSSGTTSKSKSENRSSKESKSAHKSTTLDSTEEKVTATSRSSPIRSRSSRKSQPNLPKELNSIEPSNTDLESHYVNIEAAHTITSEKPPRSSNNKGSSSKTTSANISRSKSKSPGSDEPKKKSSTTLVSSNPNPDDISQPLKRSSSKVHVKSKSKIKSNKGPKAEPEPGSLDNDIDTSTRLDQTIHPNSINYKSKTKSSPKQPSIDNEKILENFNSGALLRSKPGKTFEYNDRLVNINNNAIDKTFENNWNTNNNAIGVSHHTKNENKNFDKGSIPKLEIITKKASSRAPSDNVKESLPKLKEISQLSTHLSGVSITSDPDNQSKPPAFKTFDPHYLHFNKSDFTPTNIENLKQLAFKSVRKQQPIGTFLPNDVTSSTSLPNKYDQSFPPQFPISTSLTNGGARVLPTIKGHIHSNTDLATRENSNALPLIGTNAMSSKNLSDSMSLNDKINIMTDEKDKRSTKVGKMVIRSQTDWLPRKVEYHERIWSNATSINDPNRYLECDTGAGKESMRDFIHRHISSKKINSSIICLEGRKDFFEYINELKMQKVSYGQWEYQRNIERAKRGMPNGLGYDQALHISPSQIFRGVYAMQSNFNPQANLI